MMIIFLILAFAIGCLVGMWMANSECKDEVRTLNMAHVVEKNRLLERIRVLAQKIYSWKSTASGLQVDKELLSAEIGVLKEKIVKLEEQLWEALNSIDFKERIARAADVEAFRLKAEIALMKSRFDRPHCDRCGKIVAKKDFKEGKCKKCFKAIEKQSKSQMPPIEEITPEPEYLTTEQAGEVLKAGGEVEIVIGDKLIASVYYRVASGGVGCVAHYNAGRTGTCYPSVDAFVKGWKESSAKWLLYNYPPVCEKCQKPVEVGADFCDECFAKEAGIKEPTQPEPPMPEPPLLACAEVGDTCITRDGQRLKVLSITETRWMNCPILCSNKISFRLDGDVAVVGVTAEGDAWYNDMIVAIEKSRVKA